MTKTLVFLHTVASLIEPFEQLAKAKLPGVKTFHMLDEPLLAGVRQHGGLTWGSLTGDGLARLQDHIIFAEEMGADAVLVTCSSLSLGINQIEASVPVIKIDEAMIETAARAGGTVAIVATNETALPAAREMIEAAADESGKKLRIETRWVEGAFPAMLSGDYATHDRLVLAAVRELMDRADGIILAQASMARVLDSLPESERRVPVWTSPQTAMDRVAQVMRAAA